MLRSMGFISSPSLAFDTRYCMTFKVPFFHNKSILRSFSFIILFQLSRLTCESTLYRFTECPLIQNYERVNYSLPSNGPSGSKLSHQNCVLYYLRSFWKLSLQFLHILYHRTNRFVQSRLYSHLVDSIQNEHQDLLYSTKVLLGLCLDFDIYYVIYSEEKIRHLLETFSEKHVCFFFKKLCNLWCIFWFVGIVFIPILAFSTGDCTCNVSKIVKQATFSRLRKFE